MSTAPADSTVQLDEGADPSESSRYEQIRDAAMKLFTAQGVDGTSMRAVATEADVSIGLVQHYFGTKARLLGAVNEYALRTIRQSFESVPLSPRQPDAPLDEYNGFYGLGIQHIEILDYVGRALIEGGDVGSYVFDALYDVSRAHLEDFRQQGVLRPDVDEDWATINPVLLRICGIILRKHLERHIDQPLLSPEGVRRWDVAVTTLIRRGYLIDQR